MFLENRTTKNRSVGKGPIKIVVRLRHGKYVRVLVMAATIAAKKEAAERVSRTAVQWEHMKRNTEESYAYIDPIVF